MTIINHPFSIFTPWSVGFSYVSSLIWYRLFSVDDSVMLRIDDGFAMQKGFRATNNLIRNEVYDKVLDISKKNKSEGAKVGCFRHIKNNNNQKWHFDYVWLVSWNVQNIQNYFIGNFIIIGNYICKAFVLQQSPTQVRTILYSYLCTTCVSFFSCTIVLS